LLRPRRERLRRSDTEQRDEFAASKLTKLHTLPLAGLTA
jgi:hypothetical protein